MGPVVDNYRGLRSASARIRERLSRGTAAAKDAALDPPRVRLSF